MTVTVPTAASIKMRFSEFADIEDPVVEFAIEEASLEVGDTWTIRANLALVYLVAHYVAASIAASASGGEGGDGEIASESIGRFSITYAKGAFEGAIAGDKSTTSYGRRYVEMMGLNFGGPVVI